MNTTIPAISLAVIKKSLEAAEDAEMRARAMQQQKTSPAACDNEFGSPACEGCEHSEGCQAMLEISREEIQLLFTEAWQGYHEAEAHLRPCVQDQGSTESVELLARVLLDIHIHPNSRFVTDSPALWEAQYLWLHLYYQTKDEEYFERAKLCDGIRHATVCRVEDG
jgi:hypothetical protein